MSVRSDAAERVRALAAEGLTTRQIADALHFSWGYVYQLRHWRARPPAEAPVVPDTRAQALERGRAYALAKVAAGEWVLPTGEQEGGAA